MRQHRRSPAYQRRRRREEGPHGVCHVFHRRPAYTVVWGAHDLYLWYHEEWPRSRPLSRPLPARPCPGPHCHVDRSQPASGRARLPVHCLRRRRRLRRRRERRSPAHRGHPVGWSGHRCWPGPHCRHRLYQQHPGGPGGRQCQGSKCRGLWEGDVVSAGVWRILLPDVVGDRPFVPPGGEALPSSLAMGMCCWAGGARRGQVDVQRQGLHL